MKKIALVLSFALSVLTLSACDSAKDLADLAVNPPKRQSIDTSTTGVNNFFNQPGFGSIPAQYSDITKTLRLRYIRVLFAWTDDVQPTPTSTPNYSFYDDILRSAPADAEVLIVVTHAPSWMTDSNNWLNGDPRLTWVERWLKPTVARYSGSGRIVGWEVWNEPDFPTLAGDVPLDLTKPERYVELLRASAPVIRQLDPGKRVVMAATRSIQQDYPTTLNYNRQLRDLGAESLTDVWNIHYYSKRFEEVIRDGGVRDFLNGITKPIWVTESGQQGPNNQLAYVETVWPFLKEEIPRIERFYYYEYASQAPLTTNFGLRTNDPAAPVSDLYVFLRDR